MSLRLIPFADPGVPDTRSGLRLIIWLEHQQLRGQVLAVFWGLVYFGGIAAAPVAVGLAVQAAIDLSWPKLMLVLQPDDESEAGAGVRHTRVGERDEAQRHDVSQTGIEG